MGERVLAFCFLSLLYGHFSSSRVYSAKYKLNNITNERYLAVEKNKLFAPL